ncbi:hypothetical protein D0Z03_002501 [Geotrichum reessii]|nr:hypothetical protein D0Z03_002501 [Galactomyces reessii]
MKKKKMKILQSKQVSFQKENEERYSWLVKMKDADGNPTDHPDYDPRTLHIPNSAWAKFTAFEKQYWEVKSKMWNTVVFFKKGKFYELYENDAEIAHNVFDLKLAGGGRANMKLAGVPEMSFDYWAAAFIAKGYKVARVDQVETKLAKEMRESGNKKEDKVIRRELTCVLTGGTLVDDAMLVNEMSTYCMSVKQDENRFAVAFVDTATGSFLITEFEDDSEYSQFETLIAQIRPGELILEKGVISQRAVKILKNNTSINVLWNYLKPKEEFWDSYIALEQIVRGNYFEAKDLDDFSNFPSKLREICEEPERYSLSLSAFGGLCSYLRLLKIDESVISLGNIENYDPLQRSQNMILDGQSLQNLEIFANTFDNSARGTLFQLINRAITPFGKRQLQIWLCHPLMKEDQINARLDAVESIMENDSLKDFLERKMAGMPDLERLLSRIHAGRLAPKDFLRVIEGFNTVYELIAGLNENFSEETSGVNPKSKLLHEMLERTPNLEECLPEWSNAFNWDEAKTNNILIPEPGVEQDFDDSINIIKGLEEELQDKLRKYRPKQMAILVDDEGSRNVTFLYKLIDGTSPGSFGMHVATMCGIDSAIVDAAEVAAQEYEHTSKMKRLLQVNGEKTSGLVPLGLQSDFSWVLRKIKGGDDDLGLAKWNNDEGRLKHTLKCILDVVSDI